MTRRCWPTASTQSRRFRFLMAKNYLSQSELRYLTEIDHHDHEALAALDPVDGRGLGVTRYVRAAEDPQAAEIASPSPTGGRAGGSVRIC